MEEINKQEEKERLLKEMAEQRFMPVTEKTPLLYSAYGEVMDSHNPDELSYLLFYKGEYFFRIGDFAKALNNLARCLNAPKSQTLKNLDAATYNLIGIIYTYLGQETIAISNLLKCLDLCEEHESARQKTTCLINLGSLYAQVDNYHSALDYFHAALTCARSTDDGYDELQTICQAYSGICYCRLGDRESALEIYEETKDFAGEDAVFGTRACLYTFRILLSDFLNDADALAKCVQQFVNLISSADDFLELSEFYFDTCSYLIEKKKEPEATVMLQCIEQYTQTVPPAFLQFECQKIRMLYAQAFKDEAEYLGECSRLIRITPAYGEEQRVAKLASLTYMEGAWRTRQDFKKYREKSQHDQMTGLFNGYTIRFLTEELLSTAKDGPAGAMYIVSLDHLKRVNDTKGHLTGDMLVSQAAAAVMESFDENALCGRVDEGRFLVYANGATDASLATLQAELVQQNICQHMSGQLDDLDAQASVGIAIAPDCGHSYTQLYAAATSALGKARSLGRGKNIATA